MNSTIVYDRSRTDRSVTRTPNILSCDVSRPFWVSWLNGKIRLGRDELYDDDIVAWNDGSPHDVTSVGLATGVNGSGGKWEFSRDSGRNFFSINLRVNINSSYVSWSWKAGHWSCVKTPLVLLLSMTGNRIENQAKELVTHSITWIFSIRV